MQTRAILSAQLAAQRAGGRAIAKIMIPLVGHVNELARTKRLLEAEARAVERAANATLDYQFGTMIEVPRGALTADEIAREAEFFSFGTNDLTQMTFGYCRDAAEAGFLRQYVDDGVLPANPFQTLDVAVAQLVETAARKGRTARPDLRSASAASTAATRIRSPSASASGSTTCRARRFACRSHGSRPRARRSRPRRATLRTPCATGHWPSGALDAAGRARPRSMRRCARAAAQPTGPCPPRAGGRSMRRRDRSQRALGPRSRIAAPRWCEIPHGGILRRRRGIRRRRSPRVDTRKSLTTFPRSRSGGADVGRSGGLDCPAFEPSQLVTSARDLARLSLSG